MEIMSILNQKGGSAKTTTAVNLASSLAGQKKRVLLIDMDPQGSASSWLGFRTPSKGLFTLFTENGSILAIVDKTGIEGLDVIVSSPWLVSIDKALSAELGSEMILKRHLNSIKEKSWDFVLLDCPPALGIMSLNALSASQKVLIPLETHIMAVQGLGQLLNTIAVVKERLNADLEIDGILLCRVNRRTRLSQQIAADLRKRFEGQVYNTTIRESVRLAEAPSFGQPISIYDPKGSGTEDYRNLAREIIKRRKG